MVTTGCARTKSAAGGNLVVQNAVVWWTTGARVSEVLVLTHSSFIDDGYDVGVVLRTLKRRVGRPSKAQLQRASKGYIPIKDTLLLDRIACYLKEPLVGRINGCLRCVGRPSTGTSKP